MSRRNSAIVAAFCLPRSARRSAASKTPRIPGGAQQVSGLDEPGKFAGGKEGNVAGSPASNDHRFLLVHDLIENAGQVFTEARVRRFSRHRTPFSYCTAFLYARRLHPQQEQSKSAGLNSLDVSGRVIAPPILREARKARFRRPAFLDGGGRGVGNALFAGLVPGSSQGGTEKVRLRDSSEETFIDRARDLCNRWGAPWRRLDRSSAGASAYTGAAR